MIAYVTPLNDKLTGFGALLVVLFLTILGLHAIRKGEKTKAEREIEDEDK